MKSTLLAVLIVFFLMPAVSINKSGESGMSMSLINCCWAWDGNYTSGLSHALIQPNDFIPDGRTGKTLEPATLDKSTLGPYKFMILMLLTSAVTTMVILFQKE